MNFTYSTSTSDGTVSIAEDRPSDVSTSGAAGAFDTETLAADSRATAALQREVAAIQFGHPPETSQIPSSELGTGREPANAVPDAVANNWVLLAKSKPSRKIYGRILHLAQEAEPSGRAALRPGSLRTFLEFWDEVRSFAPEPELTLARNGNLVAEWHKRWNRHLDAEFKEDGMVLYGLFTGRIVSEGRDKADVLAWRLTENGRWPI